MALQRQAVLVLAGDAPGLGHLLGVLAHGLAGDPVGQARDLHAKVAKAQFADDPQLLAERARRLPAPDGVGKLLGQANLHVAHALHAAHQGQLTMGAA